MCLTDFSSPSTENQKQLPHTPSTNHQPSTNIFYSRFFFLLSFTTGFFFFVYRHLWNGFCLSLMMSCSNSCYQEKRKEAFSRRRSEHAATDIDYINDRYGSGALYLSLNAIIQCAYFRNNSTYNAIYRTSDGNMFELWWKSTFANIV